MSMFGELILNSVLESLLCLFLVCFWIKNKNKKAESFKYSEGFNFGPVLGKLRRMELSDVHTYQALYSETLFRDVIPFWEKHSLDRQHGGYYTCLTTDGAVFDTDKVRSSFNATQFTQFIDQFVWLQARQVWMFSKLCCMDAQDYPGADFEHRKQQWLEIAR